MTTKENGVENTKYVSYIRVSTKRQGDSGLGLAAQRDAIAQYLKGAEVLKEFEEVESGKKVSNRPQLEAALEHCSHTGATLIVAKLDRLSRDSCFLNNLMNSDIRFVIADFPTANKFMLQVFAALAEYERELISQRTKAALARSIKPKGVKGAENLEASAEDGRVHGQLANMWKADKFAAKAGKRIEEYKNAGLTLNEIAARLNAEKILTSRGYKRDANGKPTSERLQWTPTAVRRIQKRLESLT